MNIDRLFTLLAVEVEFCDGHFTLGVATADAYAALPGRADRADALEILPLTIEDGATAERCEELLSRKAANVWPERYAGHRRGGDRHADRRGSVIVYLARFAKAA